MVFRIMFVEYDLFLSSCFNVKVFWQFLQKYLWIVDCFFCFIPCFLIFIDEQFGQDIIKRLEQYLSGEYQPIQERFDDNGLMQMPPSVGFLKSLEKVLPKLKEILKQ